MRKFFKNLLIALNLSKERSTEEILTAVLIDQKHKNFLDDITRIRTENYYIPDYNALPKYVEYIISGTEKWKPVTVVKRPVEYKTIEEWRMAVRTELQKMSAMNTCTQLTLF